MLTLLTKYSRERRPVNDGGVRGNSRADIKTRTRPQLVGCLIGMVSHIEGFRSSAGASRGLVFSKSSLSVSLEEMEKKTKT